MNNTPFNWNNETSFVPAKPTEKTMTTFDHLETAEKALRNALKSTDDTTKAFQLRKLVDLISSVEDTKRNYKAASSSTFTVSGNFEDLYGGYNYTPDTINFGAAQPVNIPGAMGNDVITFS